MKKKAPRDFGKPGHLNESWEDKHKYHFTVSFMHTVFKGVNGTIYQEHRCYVCNESARHEIGTMKAKPEPSPPKEKRFQSRRKNTSTFEKFEASAV